MSSIFTYIRVPEAYYTYYVEFKGANIGKVSKQESASCTYWFFEPCGEYELCKPSEDPYSFGGWSSWCATREAAVCQYFGNVMEAGLRRKINPIVKLIGDDPTNAVSFQLYLAFKNLDFMRSRNGAALWASCNALRPSFIHWLEEGDITTDQLHELCADFAHYYTNTYDSDEAVDLH